MLTLLGFSMIACFMYLIMSKRLSALMALVLVPIAFAAIVEWTLGAPGLTLAGHVAAIGKMSTDGIKTLAPTGVMLVFAILYFSLMNDAGLFEPLIRFILRTVGGDPLKIVMGTTLLGVCLSLDGDGAPVYLILVPALLPLYQRLGMRLQVMATMLLLSVGIMHLVPWGGPTARAAAAMQVSVSDVFVPMIPVMAVGVVWLLGLAWFLGRGERRRVGIITLEEDFHQALGGDDAHLRRPNLVVFNTVLTLALITGLTFHVLPLPLLFMAAFALAMVVNYPDLGEQRKRVAAHAHSVLAVVAVVFAASVFTGVLSGSGMVDAMAKATLQLVPQSLGPYMGSLISLIAIPGTYLVSNDAFYFGVLPTLAHTAQAYGINPIEVARAAIISQPTHMLSPLTPSTYLLVGLLSIDYSDNQRATLGWAIVTSLVLMLAGIALGAIPLWGRGL